MFIVIIPHTSVYNFFLGVPGCNFFTQPAGYNENIHFLLPTLKDHLRIYFIHLLDNGGQLTGSTE